MDRIVVRGDLAKREFIGFWTLAGRVVAGMSVNVWDVMSRIQELVYRAEPVDLAQLADPGIALDDLTPTWARRTARR